ncbi:MAG: hypothetical protein AAGI22_03955 [Planctomycetota bacterium]
MPRRLFTLVGVALAVLLLLRLMAGMEESQGPPSVVEKTRATVTPSADGPVRLEDVATRESLPVDDGAARAGSRLRAETPPPAPVAVAKDGHWIEGRAVLTDGTSITGHRVVAIEPPEGNLSDRDLAQLAQMLTVRDPLGTATLDELGRFRLGPFPAGRYGLVLDSFHTWFEDTCTFVEAPTSTAELRIDAMLVVIQAPQEALVRREGERSEERFTIASSRFWHSGSASFDEDGRTERLLTAGIGYRFEYSPGDGRLFQASLDALVPPGRHHVWLEEYPFQAGMVRAVLVGEADDRDLNVTVGVTLTSAAAGRSGVPARNVKLKLGRLARPAEAEDEFVLPGRYSTRAYLVPGRKTSWTEAVARPAEIEVRPGEVTEVQVELIEGGRLSVSVEGRPGADGSLVQLESYDAEKETWNGLRVQTIRSRKALAPASESVSLSMPNIVERAFPPGPLRVRLRGEGWRTVESTVTIVDGQTTTWRPRMVRE